jgi:repressor LexA
MMEEGILDGDVVVVKQQSTARNGDIVVALVDGEATVKFYFHEGSRIRLQPAHPTMAPIYVDPSQTSGLQGIVVGVYRQYH